MSQDLTIQGLSIFNSQTDHSGNHPDFLVKPSLLSKVSWDNKIYSRIIQFANEHPGGVVVFDADGTLWADDVTETFFRWLISNHKLTTVDYNRDNFKEYEERVKKDALSAYKWLVRKIVGMSENEIIELSHTYFRKYFADRIYPCQQKLISELKKLDMDIWILSASNKWLVQAGAEYVGVDPAHVLAVDLEVKKGILTDKIIEPFTYREGKVQAIKQFIGKKPVMVFGDSLGDIPMLNEADGVRVFIKHAYEQNDEAVKLAKENGCLIQYFPLLPLLKFENRQSEVKTVTI